ncbi:MAG: winged helix-turn-helix transcriptional regulator [Acidobacteria bacterium]|nr:winged helix-turn-helix transcriptional regulator [Acidobacteriota bacterium]
MELKVDENLMFYLGHVMKLFGVMMTRQFEEADVEISFHDWIKLFIIKEKEHVIQKDIAEVSGIHKTTLTRSIDFLESENYVIRQQDEHDKRQNKLILTEKGEIIVKKYKHILIDIQSTMLKGITEDELTNTKMVLNKILINFQSDCCKE